MEGGGVKGVDEEIFVNGDTGGIVESDEDTDTGGMDNMGKGTDDTGGSDMRREISSTVLYCNTYTNK